MAASEEIARLKVEVTGATEAQVARLERLDKVVSSLQRHGTVSLNIRGNLPSSNAEEALSSVTRSISSGSRGVSEEYRRLVQAQQIQDSIAKAEQRRQQQEINHLTEVQRIQDSIAKAYERRQKEEEAQQRREIERLTEIEQIRQSIEDAYARRQQEEDRQLQEQQDRIQTGWEIIGGYLYRSLVQNIQKATDELKAMNKEMVSIQKVTQATDADMERMKNSAFEVAGDLGAKPSEYLASATKWAQAGYKDLSEQLGALSAKTQVVGDVNEETANKFLLAVDAAYKYKGNIDQLTRVLDGANEISNNYATSVEKLAGGMGIVSSLAEQAGMKVEETMAAIGTITHVTQESGNSAARALRALILNIQGSTEIEIDAETGERWSEDEIQRTAAALGELNVKTREYKDGIMQLRNPMQVIGELAEKYRAGLVTEAQLQEVVASLGGKIRSNQLMALIQGYETYTSMIETYKDALGSADSELQIYLNGWEAKSNKLVAQWAQFVESFKASDISMTALDLASALMEIANTPVGQIVTLTAAITALNAALKTERGTAIISALATIPRGLAGIASKAKEAAGDFTGLTAVINGAKGGIAEFGKILYSALGPVGVFIIGLTTLTAIIDALTVSASEQAEKMADAQQEYASAQAAVEGLQSQLKTTQDRIDELNSKGSQITVVEREELDRLKEENDELERQLIIEKDLANLRKEALREETEKTLNKGYTGANYSFSPSRDSRVGSLPITKENIEYELGQYSGFEKQADHLGRLLDGLQEKKEKFLSEHGDESGWSVEEAKEYKKITDEIDTARGVAISFRKELRQAVDNLADGEEKDRWNEITTSLWESMYPAEALTEKLERLVDAMDEAEKTKFNEMLVRIQKDGKVTEEEVQALIDKFPILKPLLEGNAEALGILAQHFTEATQKTQENADANQNSQEAMADFAKTLKTTVSKMKDIKDAQDELKSGSQISTNTIISLLGKHGDALDEVLMKYMGGVATAKEVGEALKKAYEKELDEYRNIILQKEAYNEDFYIAWLGQNSKTVKKLADQYGVNAGDYKHFAELKTGIEAAAQAAQTNAALQGKNDRLKIFQDIQTAFEDSQNAMVAKAEDATKLISRMYSLLGGLMGGIANGISGLMGTAAQVVGDKMAQIQADRQAEAAEKLIRDSLGSPNLKSSSKSKSGSTKTYYEKQIEALKKLEEATKRTNQVLEKSDEDTAQKRVENLRGMQEKILAAQKDFIARGLVETSDEVNQLKIMYAGLGDDIKSIYAGLADKLEEKHEDLIWQFEKKSNNKRTVEQIAADDAAMVDEYRKMQQEVHQLAEYYRSQGVRENDKLIRDLQDKWWEYEKAIRSMYDNLTDAFNDYIDESSHKIEELGRTPGNVGKQIEIYAERIKRAQETIAALQANNINGENNGKIFDLESQIWGDKDAIRDIQNDLWDELERAFDDIFDGVKEDIDAIQDQMDEINEILERYDKELEGILEPINATIEALEKQLEAERERLEAQTQPLKDQKDALSDRISGYYTINPDGSIGPYIKGLDDEIDEIQDQLDKANEELDRVNEEWNAQKDREEEALALQKKQLAVEEAQKAVQDALLALQTARNERNIYTLKDGVWAWRADEEKVAQAEKALAEAEKAKEEAEKDLQDYKEEQAHKLIVKRLEEQIKALEDQKKLLDKQRDLINKQIEAIQKQITAYEKESQARTDFIQGLIDQNEAEKEAWEDHYEQLKDQYDQQLDMLEEQKKAAEKQYDQWMDTWKDIQKSIETPARSISEILNDIAQYGTPAMADQVDRVTDLLRQLGYAIEDVTSGGGFDPDSGSSGGDSVDRRAIIDQMVANAYAWESARTEAERQQLQAENQRLGAMIGANYNPASGQWDIFDYSNGQITVKPWAYGDSGYSVSSYGEGVRVPTLAELENDGFAEYKARNGILMAPQPYAPGYSMASYTSAGPTTYNDDHSITINGMRVGSDMMQRPFSELVQLFSLHMGT